MGNLNLILFVCLAIPMSMMIWIFRGHSRSVCAFLLVGMFMCVFSGEINGLLLQQGGLDTQDIAVNMAPMVEELAKALPILFIAFLLKPTGQKLAEFSLAVGVGFATLENVSVLINAGAVSFSYAILRALGAGMMHGICTLIIGIAMAGVIGHKIVFVSGTLSTLSAAVIYHSIYNMLITSRYMVVGAVLPIVTFAVIVVAGTVQRRKSAKRLRESAGE